MEFDRMISMFSSLETEEKAFVLARLAFEFTVLARDAYIGDSEAVSQPKQLRVYNEMQHKLPGQLCKILFHDKTRYPDDVFFTIISAMAEEAGILSNVRSILRKSLEVQHTTIPEQSEKERIYA